MQTFARRWIWPDRILDTALIYLSSYITRLIITGMLDLAQLLSSSWYRYRDTIENGDSRYAFPVSPNPTCELATHKI